MSTVDVAPEQKLVLEGEPWETYVRLLRLFEERHHLRITYDRGALEIMTLSAEHEAWKHLIGRLIVTLTEELGLPVAGYGSLTIKRRRNLRGLEPDECFWIANEQRVRGLSTYDIRRDPPPDLVVEIDVTRSSLDRLAIYAALRVAEVWQFSGHSLQFHVLDADGQYQEQACSRSFPRVSADDIGKFLALRGTIDENSIIRQFREWIRGLIAQ